MPDDQSRSNHVSLKLLLSAALVLGIPAPVQAENLLKVSETPEETSFVDLDSIQLAGTSKRFWEVERLAFPDKYRVVLRRTYVEIDCNARMRAQRAYVDYDAQGTVVYSDGSLDTPARWRPIVPGSRGELIRLIVCNR